jgi:hypothetical protein
MEDNFKQVAIDFAKKLGEHEYRELASNLVGVSFKQAFINLQGYNLDDGTYYFELQQWEPTASVLWSVKGLDRPKSLEAFLKEPLFDGKTFWECEKEMEWVDE